MPAYRKKPIVIQAVQWTGRNAAEIKEFTHDAFSPEHFLEYPECVAGIYDKLHGTWIRVNKLDWVIRGVKGEFYPCNAEVFIETFEPVQ